MRRSWLLALGAALLFGTFSQTALVQLPPALPGEESGVVMGRAPMLAWSNVPANGSNISGGFSLQITATPNSLNWLSIYIDNGSGESEISNLSGSPWIYYWDTTTVDNLLTWSMRAWGEEAGGGGTNYTNNLTAGNFTVWNAAAGGGGNPLITNFTVQGAATGNGTDAGNRAWHNISATGTMTFNYSVDESNGSWVNHTNLMGTPGTGNPPGDADPKALGWAWTPGDLAEGIYTVVLTAFDNESDTNNSFLYLGIDRTGPLISAPVIDVGSTWTAAETVNFSGIDTTATDLGGSGIGHYEAKDSMNSMWQTFGNGSGMLAVEEGTRTLQFRAVDRAGNSGTILTAEINIDRTAPTPGTWSVDEVNTSTTDPLNLAFSAADPLSGIDSSASRLQYGFDSDGSGTTPDQSGDIWTDVAADGLSHNLTGIDWSTHSKEFLMLRAIITDDAANVATSNPEFVLILPGVDLSWGITSQDRIVVRPGGVVNVSSVIEVNEPYAGAVTVRLESAPADRGSGVNFTVVETRVIHAGDLNDTTETLQWSVTVSNTVAQDLRLVLDTTDAVEERDEGNNAVYLLVQGIDSEFAGTVPGFAPSLGTLVAVGFLVAWLGRHRTDAEA